MCTVALPRHGSFVSSHLSRGQDLRSSTSHKSYRPVTTLFFRVLNILGGEWLPWETEEDGGWRGVWTLLVLRA